MNEGKYKSKNKIYRLIAWVGIAISLLGAIISTPSSLTKPEYVPTIISGLVTGMSILMAFALFFVGQTYTRIKDEVLRIKFNLRATLYLLVIFFLLLLGVTVGYRLVLENELRNAFIIFMITFILMFGLIMDLWMESPI